MVQRREFIARAVAGIGATLVSGPQVLAEGMGAPAAKQLGELYVVNGWLLTASDVREILHHDH